MLVCVRMSLNEGRGNVVSERGEYGELYMQGLQMVEMQRYQLGGPGPIGVSISIG